MSADDHLQVLGVSAHWRRWLTERPARLHVWIAAYSEGYRAGHADGQADGVALGFDQGAAFANQAWTGVTTAACRAGLASVKAGEAQARFRRMLSSGPRRTPEEIRRAAAESWARTPHGRRRAG